MSCLQFLSANADLKVLRVLVVVVVVVGVTKLNYTHLKSVHCANGVVMILHTPKEHALCQWRRHDLTHTLGRL